MEEFKFHQRRLESGLLWQLRIAAADERGGFGVVLGLGVGFGVGVLGGLGRFLGGYGGFGVGVLGGLAGFGFVGGLAGLGIVQWWVGGSVGGFRVVWWWVGGLADDRNNKVAKELREKGIKADYYHADMEVRDRENVHTR
ncbi:Mediator of RNA polymerase II transcription subunit 34 [Bienertia sinuspersici]